MPKTPPQPEEDKETEAAEPTVDKAPVETRGVLASTSGRRGRAPARIMFKDGTELGTYDANALRLAAEHVGKEATYSYKETTSKKTGEVYKTLIFLEVDGVAQESPGSAIAIPEIIPPRRALERAPQALLIPVSPIEELEQQVAWANRAHELIVQMFKARMKEDLHYDSGKTFGSKKPVLLQPGAYLIFQGLGYYTVPKILEGPKEAPSDRYAQYTLVIECPVYNRHGHMVGMALGSASSLIWSGNAGANVPRAVDPDKTYNTTLKMAVKRAEVAGCRKTTPAHEIFSEDLDDSWFPAKTPPGPGGTDPDQAPPAKSKGFIKRRT